MTQFRSILHLQDVSIQAFLTFWDLLICVYGSGRAPAWVRVAIRGSRGDVEEAGERVELEVYHQNIAAQASPHFQLPARGHLHKLRTFNQIPV